MTMRRTVLGVSCGLDTHKWPPYEKAFHEALRMTHYLEGDILDPFARGCPWGTVRNDIDPDQPTQYHLDAAVFMESRATSTARIILFDPPFSSHQADRYEAGDTNLYTAGDGRMGRMHRSIGRILKPGGVCIKLGYNSSRPSPALELIHLEVLSPGGVRNDVLMSTWQRVNGSLEDWI